MHKETITYVDYNGEERSEDFYFNLNSGEVIKLQMLTKNGVDGYIEKIINEHDQKKITKFFCKIIKMTYGVKTLDGGFDKSKKIFKKFESSEAYSVLFTRLATDADFAARFISSILPKEPLKPQDHKLSAAEQAKKEAKERLQLIQNESATTQEA